MSCPTVPKLANAIVDKKHTVYGKGVWYICREEPPERGIFSLMDHSPNTVHAQNTGYFSLLHRDARVRSYVSVLLYNSEGYFSFFLHVGFNVKIYMPNTIMSMHVFQVNSIEDI